MGTPGVALLCLPALLAGQGGIPNKMRNSAFLLLLDALPHMLDAKKFRCGHFYIPSLQHSSILKQ